MTIKRRPFSAALLLLAAGALFLFSCSDEEFLTPDVTPVSQRPSSGTQGRAALGKARKVLLLYSAAFNSIDWYLDGDLEELSRSEYLPGNRESENVLLIFSKTTNRSGDYKTLTEGVLYRLYKRYDGKVARDTVMRVSPYTPAASASTMRSVLSFVKENYPSDSYGMIFSSHASGWLPSRYYMNPGNYESRSSGALKSAASGPLEWPFDPATPTRSIGQDLFGKGMTTLDGSLLTTDTYHEITLDEFVSAIPMHLDYLLFDACLMMCIETCHALREKVDILAGSPAETPASGFDYTGILRHLFRDGAPDLAGACQECFDSYDAKSGIDRSCILSVVDLTRMDALASVCREIFTTYRSDIMKVRPSDIQPYFRFNRNYFYDFKDILDHCQLPSDLTSRLESAVSDFVVYKAATPSFLGSFKVTAFSGVSMFLPSIKVYYSSKNYTYLFDYYKSHISWNDATLLVE